jgi:hypothetical protein
MNVKLHAVLAGVVAIVLCGADVPTGGNVQPTATQSYTASRLGTSA